MNQENLRINGKGGRYMGEFGIDYGQDDLAPYTHEIRFEENPDRELYWGLVQIAFDSIYRRATTISNTFGDIVVWKTHGD